MANKTQTISKTCPNCGKETRIEVEEAKLRRWVGGEHIQDVWPEKSPTERETMMTGTCSDECWDEMFPPDA